MLQGQKESTFLDTASPNAASRAGWHRESNDDISLIPDHHDHMSDKKAEDSATLSPGWE